MLGFSISVSGVHAGLRRTDVAANNIANATTPAFKASRDLGSVRVRFSQGPLEPEDGRFSLAIDGEGFFRVQTPEGERYTRAGSFHVDASGKLVTTGGSPLQPSITIPGNAVGITVGPQGQVSAVLPGGQTQSLGSVGLARFANPEGLTAEGGSLFAAGPASGPPLGGASGRILFGAVEGSNVDLADEVVSLIVSRISVEANLAAVKTRDDILGEIIDLRG